MKCWAGIWEPGDFLQWCQISSGTWEKEYSGPYTDNGSPEQEENAEQEELNNSNKKTSKKALISIAALCAALGIVTGIVIGKSGNKKVKDYDTPTKIEEVDNTKVDNLEFTDINDEEQVAKRAYDIKMEIDKQVPNNDYSIEEIENMLKWYNGGVVEEVKTKKLYSQVVELNT